MIGAGVIGAGVIGAGVTGAGVTGAGVTGAGVTGAGVPGAGVTGAGPPTTGPAPGNVGSSFLSPNMFVIRPIRALTRPTMASIILPNGPAIVFDDEQSALVCFCTSLKSVLTLELLAAVLVALEVPVALVALVVLAVLLVLAASTAAVATSYDGGVEVVLSIEGIYFLLII